MVYQISIDINVSHRKAIEMDDDLEGTQGTPNLRKPSVTPMKPGLDAQRLLHVHCLHAAVWHPRCGELWPREQDVAHLKRIDISWED